LVTPFADPSKKGKKLRIQRKVEFAVSAADANNIEPLSTKTHKTDPLKAFLETL